MTAYIWHLSRINNMVQREIKDIIVAAATEKEARQLANQNSKEEGYIWTDGALVSARKLGAAEDDINGIIVQATEIH